MAPGASGAAEATAGCSGPARAGGGPGPAGLAPMAGAAASAGGGAGGDASEAAKKAAQAELEKRVQAAVKSAMNTALDEARARGGSSWDAAAKIAKAQGMEQLYAREVQDAANVGLVFYTDGLEDAYNLRLAQMSRDGLSKAVLGYVSTAWPPLGVVLSVYDALSALFSFDFGSITGHGERTHLYNEIRARVIANNDAVLQAQYINLRILWLSCRSLNGLGPNTALNPWNEVPHAEVTFDDIFQTCLRKKGAYDTNLWGDGSTRSFAFDPALGFWGSQWIGWPKDPSDEDLAFYAEQVSAAYAAYKMAPLNEASNNVVELVFGSIAKDMRLKREQEAAQNAAAEAARKAAEEAARKLAEQRAEADATATAHCDKIETCVQTADGVAISSSIALGVIGFGRRTPGDREALYLARIKEASDQVKSIRAQAAKSLVTVRNAQKSTAQMWAAVAQCAAHRAVAEIAAAEAERCGRGIESARKHDQEEKARSKARLASDRAVGDHGMSKGVGTPKQLTSEKTAGSTPKAGKPASPATPVVPRQKK